MTQILLILLVAFGIGLVIYVHELGHFLCARWIGVRVEVFSLGFGKRLCGFRRNGTDYRISLVPVGGYVAVAGHDPSDRRYPAEECLWAKSVGQRALYFCGGVVMNVLLALVLFPIVLRVGVTFLAPEVGTVATGSPAWEARLQPGDEILTLNGKAMYSFENLTAEVALAGHRPIALEVRRGDQVLPIEVLARFDAEDGLYGLGIGPAVEAVPPTLRVRADGPAAAAGLADGDLVLAVDGAPTIGREGAVRVDALTAPDRAPATLRVRRGESEREVVLPPAPPSTALPPRIGVAPMPRLVAGLRPGLAALQDLDLRRLDRILQVDGAPFAGDLRTLADGPPRLVMKVRRGDDEIDLSAAFTPADRRALADHVGLVGDVDGMVLLPTADGRAAVAGMRPGDQLVAVGGEPITDWEALIERVQASAPEEPLTFTVRRDGQEVALPIRPARQADLGLLSELPRQRVEVRHENIGAAVKAGVVMSLDLIRQIYVTLKGMVTGQVGANNLGGIVGISTISYRLAQWGPSRFFFFLAMLSINLAVVNLLPIPVLDGGYLLFLAIEKIKGSPVSGRVMGYSQVLGLVFVLALLVFVTYNDILRLL